MGIATKADDDIAVLVLEIQVVLDAIGAEQLNGEIVNQQ